MKSIITFGLGFVLGGFVTLLITKRASGTEDFEDSQENTLESEEPQVDIVQEHEAVIKLAKEKPDPSTYLKNDINYNTVSGSDEKKTSSRPRVISPDDFDDTDYDDYSKITLMWYSDKTLVDENDRVIPKTDYSTCVGETFHEHFGEYEKDCVYVRNDRRKTDYEVLVVEGSYDDVLYRKPYLEDDYEGNDE